MHKPLPALFVAGLLLALPCLAQMPAPAPAFRNNRLMAPNDPNMDAGWRWWEDAGRQTVYYSPTRGIPNVAYPYLPWYTEGNILKGYKENLDFYPEDGWMLAYKDFGTPQEGVQFPYFALYNKYRGKFRLMVYKPYEQNSTYYDAELRFMLDPVDKPHSTALLTFRAKEKCFLDTFDRQQIDSTIGYMDVYGSWGVFDFDLAGYDPKLDDVSVDPVIQIAITGVVTGSITGGASGSLQLNQMLGSSALLTNTRSDWEKIQDAYKNGSKYYKEVRGFQNDLKEKLSEQEKLKDAGKETEWWYSAALDLSSLALNSYAPYAGALVGAIQSFIGGGGRSTPLEPLRFQGLIDFQIGLKTKDDQAVLAPIDLFLKPGPMAPSTQRPVQKIPWGVFNMVTKPKLACEDHFTNWGEWRYNARTRQLEWNKLGEQYAYSILSGTLPEVIINPNLGMQLVTKKVKFITGVKSDAFTDYDFGSTGVIGPKDLIGLELTFKTNEPTRNWDSEIKIIRSLPLDTDHTTVLDPVQLFE